MIDDRARRGVAGPLDPSAEPDATLLHRSLTSFAQTLSAAPANGSGPVSIAQELAALDLATRRALANRLAARPDTPKAVALALALDKIAVADPVLRFSPVLDDADLLHLIEETSHEHHLAIAERAEVSPSVAAFLVEMSETDVMAQLLRNPGAMFTEYVFRRLVAASRHAEPLREPVIARRETTLEMAQDLSRWVDAGLRRRIAERFGPEAVISMHGDAASLEPHPSPRPAAPPAPQPGPRRPRGRSHPLVDAIRRNDRRQLEATLANMSGLPRFAVLRILSDPDAESLAVVCRGLALKRRLFAALYARLHEGHTVSRGFAGGAFPAALAYFNRLRSPQAAGILQGWRKAPITVWQSSRSWTGRSWLGPGDQAA